jgi:hypothetical protein
MIGLRMTASDILICFIVEQVGRSCKEMSGGAEKWLKIKQKSFR